MCVEAVFPDGEVVGEFSRLAERVGPLTIRPSYDGIDLTGSCLCPVDLEATFKAAGLRMKEGSGRRVIVRSAQ